jgi:hypothetical protein
MNEEHNAKNYDMYKEQLGEGSKNKTKQNTKTIQFGKAPFLIRYRY